MSIEKDRSFCYPDSAVLVNNTKHYCDYCEQYTLRYRGTALDAHSGEATVIGQWCAKCGYGVCEEVL